MENVFVVCVYGVFHNVKCWGAILTNLDKAPYYRTKYKSSLIFSDGNFCIIFLLCVCLTQMQRSVDNIPHDNGRNATIFWIEYCSRNRYIINVLDKLYCALYIRGYHYNEVYKEKRNCDYIGFYI